MSISGKIQTFNAAYKIAWDLAIARKTIVPGLALKLSDAVKAMMKQRTDPAEIAEAAVRSL